MKPTDTPFYSKLAFILVSLVALGYLVVLGKDILAPLIFAFLFAILLLPLVNFFEKKCHFSSVGASITSIMLLLIAVSAIMYLLGDQLAGLATDWPLLKQNILATSVQFQQWIESRFHINAARQLSYINTATNNILSSSTAVIGSMVVSVSSIIIFNIFILIYTFLLLLYRRLLFRFILAVFRDENTAIVYEITEEVKYIIGKYIIGILAEMGIVIVLSCSAYWALGVNYALLLGLLTGILNLIPYLGIFTALLLSALINFATGGVHQTLYLIITALVIHLIDSNYIMPKIVGSKVRINPLIVILGVLTGEKLWGISGMFLSIPVIAIMKVIFDRIDSLKPWGLLLGDDIEKPSKRHLLLKLKELKKKRIVPSK
jgi:predicted PurR-regulated permease PerM